MGVSYQYGIVVYVNGHEMYRDNVEDGPIHSFTEYSNSYSTLSFHPFARSAYYLSSDEGNTVAVMLLLPSDSYTTFDAWLSLYSPSPLYSSGVVCYNTVSGDHSLFDMVESTTFTILSGYFTMSNNAGGINGVGFSQPSYASSNLVFVMEWKDHTNQYGNQRQYAFAPMTTSKGWYHYGMPPVQASAYSFSIMGGAMTFSEIRFLICRTDTKGLVYPSSVNMCYTNNPCTIRPLSPVPGSVTANNLPSGLSISSETGIISGTPRWTGDSVYAITSNGNTFNLRINVDFTTSISSFSYPGTHSFCRNQEIGLKPEVTGAPFRVSIESGSLPSGLSLDADTGIISGFASVGRASLTLKASNSEGSFQTTTILEIGSDPTGDFYPYWNEAERNRRFSILPTTNCIGCTYTIRGSLPSGISLDPSTGVISGSSSVSMAFETFTVTRSNPCGSATSTFELAITSQSGGVEPITQFKYEKSKFTLVKGKPFSAKPTFNGNEVVFQIVAGKLPGGLVLDKSGVIKGTPIESSSASSVMVRARNSVSKADVNVEFKVNSLSVGVVVIIILLIVLVLAVFFAFLFMCHRKRLNVRSVEEVQKSLPKPVPAGGDREVGSAATVVINNVPSMGSGGVSQTGGVIGGNMAMAGNPMSTNQAMTSPKGIISPVTSSPVSVTHMTGNPIDNTISMMNNPIGAVSPMTNNPMGTNQTIPSNPMYPQAPSGIPMNPFRM